MSVEPIDDESPFHRGEREMQVRTGARDKIESIGRRVIRDFMPDQHREFAAQLPFIVLGALDSTGHPCATMIAGRPGFMFSPDPRRLRIDARLPPADPLSSALHVGADVGLLGIEFHTRRRNRMNGAVIELDARGFTVEVAQSFGNCPQYINVRDYALIENQEHESAAAERISEQLDGAAIELVRSADTFFIATHYREPERRRWNGADVSHRGGTSGFVRIDDARTLTWPDYRGNFLFNTLGNLLLNPRAGLLFADFGSGTLLNVFGRTEIIWDGAAVRAVAGAQRLVRFHVERVALRRQALPLRWAARA